MNLLTTPMPQARCTAFTRCGSSSIAPASTPPPRIRLVATASCSLELKLRSAPAPTAKNNLPPPTRLPSRGLHDRRGFHRPRLLQRPTGRRSLLQEAGGHLLD